MMITTGIKDLCVRESSSGGTANRQLGVRGDEARVVAVLHCAYGTRVSKLQGRPANDLARLAERAPRLVVLGAVHR